MHIQKQQLFEILSFYTSIYSCNFEHCNDVGLMFKINVHRVPMCGEGSKKMRFVVLLWGVLSNYAKDKEDYANCQSYFYIASQHYHWAALLQQRGWIWGFLIKNMQGIRLSKFQHIDYICFIGLLPKYLLSIYSVFKHL